MGKTNLTATEISSLMASYKSEIKVLQRQIAEKKDIISRLRKEKPVDASPKRRGRPPKAASTNSATPKRRGRPPKAASATAPKRRGRPPKAASATAAAPKRRGRPPKAASAAAAAPKKRRGRPPKKK